MAQFLLELYSEDIPSRMQAGAADALRAMMTAALVERGLAHGTACAFATPQRLTLVIDDLAPEVPAQREEKRGPRVGAPDAAIQGFLKGAGLSSLDQCVERDTGKGVFWFAWIDKPAQRTADILPGLIHAIIETFPWPKSMRWGRASRLNWVRPLRRVLAIYDGAPLALDMNRLPPGTQVGNETVGHRFMGAGPFAVTDFADYETKLRQAHVVLDAADRRAIILREAQALAQSRGFALVPHEGLLNEVAGLVEWPVPLMGGFDPAFLDVPPEVLMTSMRVHQKYFAVSGGSSQGALAPHFVVIANRVASDGGAAIIAGNERVLAARLSDAKFFWDQDRKTPLRDRVAKLRTITFHAKLGSMGDKTQRVKQLAHALAGYVPRVNADLIDRAADLLKADLTTGMVGEFPELQGVMGRYYALHDGEDQAVADAIRDHYLPKGADDAAPIAPLSILMALADKFDTLVGFFSIGEKPTGSKDPFALRRAALGVIRIILENEIRLPLGRAVEEALRSHGKDEVGAFVNIAPILEFIIERLYVQLREQGLRYDVLRSVLLFEAQNNASQIENIDLVAKVRLARVLQQLLDTDTGRNLLAAYNRAANIVRIEMKKDAAVAGAVLHADRLQQAEEKNLYAALRSLDERLEPALAAEDFEGACAALAQLRAPLDAFFDKVTVNDKQTELRLNRLALLKDIQVSMNRIADFSRIEG